MPNEDMVLSLVIITKNNEKDLERCLKSVKGLVDEIILVDTGSSDGTKKIAAKFTDKIHDFKWTGDFSEAKNYALNLATGRWIINLDADESVSREDHGKITNLIKNAPSNVFGFSLIQRNYTSKPGSFGWVSSTGDEYEESRVATGFIPRRIVRLFRKDLKIYFEGRVHDSVEKSIIRENKNILALEVPIHHFGMLNRSLDRTKMYIDMEKENLRKGDSFQMYQIATQLHSVGDLDDALAWLDSSLEANPKFNLAWLEKGTILLERGNFERALYSLKEAESLGEHEMIFGHLGITLAQLERIDEAIEYFRKAIKMNPKNADFYFNLGLTLNSANRKTEAGLAFKKALELNPEYSKMVKMG